MNLEFDKSSSMMYDNVKNIQNIKGEALDFSKWSTSLIKLKIVIMLI